MAARALPPREGRPNLPGPFEGVPGHLAPPMSTWLRDQLIYRSTSLIVKTQLLHAVTAAARVAIPAQASSDQQSLGYVVGLWNRDAEAFLDILHALLQLEEVPESELAELNHMLDLGGSVWKATERGLQRRADPVAQRAAEEAVLREDAASVELAEAWAKAYGRDPDPSDAWDHAIKAVEAVMIPVVVPTQAGAHMGHVIGQLDRQGEHWNTLLRFNQTKAPNNPPHNSVQALVGMLRLIYPNPDRHLGPNHRVPMIEEARGVVHLAVTIVQWGRDGLIAERPAN